MSNGNDVMSFNEFFKQRIRLAFSSIYRFLVDRAEREKIAKGYKFNKVTIYKNGEIVNPSKREIRRYTEHWEKQAANVPNIQEPTQKEIINKPATLSGVVSDWFGITTLLRTPYDYCHYRLKKLNNSDTGFWWKLGRVLSSPFKLISMALSPRETFHLFHNKLKNYGMPETAEQAVDLFMEQQAEKQKTPGGASPTQASDSYSQIGQQLIEQAPNRASSNNPGDIPPVQESRSTNDDLSDDPGAEITKDASSAANSPSWRNNMTHPKVSGILNNCTLDCGIPAIEKLISDMAKVEKEKALYAIKNHPVVKNLKILKEIFAEHYKLNSEQFNWKQFDNFIKQHDNFLEKQMIFAPVFRKFLAKQMSEDDPRKDSLSTIQDDIGRYECLEPKVALDFFYTPLGIRAEFIFLGYEDYTNPIQNLWTDSFSPLADIEIFFKNNHCELSAENHSKDNPYIAGLSAPFKTAYDKISSNEATENHFNDICDAVSNNIRSNILGAAAQESEPCEQPISNPSYSRTKNNYKEHIKELRRLYFDTEFFKRVEDKTGDEKLAMRLQEAECRHAFGPRS